MDKHAHLGSRTARPGRENSPGRAAIVVRALASPFRTRISGTRLSGGVQALVFLGDELRIQPRIWAGWHRRSLWRSRYVLGVRHSTIMH